MTNQESILQEKKQIEAKIRKLQAKMIQDMEKGRFWRLDHQVRQVQQSYQLMERV